MGILDKIGGSEMQQMMLFMFLGIVVAILVLGFHRSPKPAPNPSGTGLKGMSQTRSTQANQNLPILGKPKGAYY